MPKIQEYTEFNNIGDDFVFLTEKRNTEENPINPTLITTFGNLKSIIWNWISNKINLVVSGDALTLTTSKPNATTDSLTFTLAGRYNVSKWETGKQYEVNDICWTMTDNGEEMLFYNTTKHTSTSSWANDYSRYWNFLCASDINHSATLQTTSWTANSSNTEYTYTLAPPSNKAIFNDRSIAIIDLVYDSSFGTYEQQAIGYNCISYATISNGNLVITCFQKPPYKFKIKVKVSYTHIKSADSRQAYIMHRYVNSIDDTLTESTAKTWSIDKIKTEIDSVPTKIINNTEVEPTASTWSVDRIMEVLSAFITVNEETFDALPETGEAGKVYVVGENKYVWVVSANQFIKIA